MDILVNNGYARKMEIGDGRTRYEIKMGSPHHDHLICTSCGKIVEFVDQEVEDLQHEIATRYHFKLQRHIHHLFGICRKCR
jgi:Fur family ferric uptake transcriptional regulator